MTAPNPPLPGAGKLTPGHLARRACIYIRQSSLQQVARHRESQFNQYQLRDRAQALGWPLDRIQVIDVDLGVSARHPGQRTGFEELVTAVSLGQVGCVFGYEVSRLARNNQDWYHLLDLAALFGTLIADTDGLYDPRLYNDRLLLGLKGTMSEAELHWIRQRLTAGRLAQVQRGAYRQRLPTGLVRRLDGAVVQDPDDQVRHVLTLVLEQFAALGSCHQVLVYCRQAGILLPRRQWAGVAAGSLQWKPAATAAIYAIVGNPAYAGAFAYGRRQHDPLQVRPGAPASGKRRCPPTEWVHVEHGVYPAYITWEQYTANQTRLQQNAARFTEANRAHGAVRTGPALLAGLIRCGRCGHALRVGYKRIHHYECDELERRYGEAQCAFIPGPSIDAVVVAAFLEALAPAHLDVLAAVLADQQAEHARLVQYWHEQQKRAAYEVALAARQYQAVDPDNRLVAAELERRWETALRSQQQTAEAVARFAQEQPPPALTDAQRRQFSAMAAHLPDLWQQGALSSAQQKELLRCLITQVIVERTAPDCIAVKVVWVSGHYSEREAHPPVLRAGDVSTRAALLARVQELWQAGQADEQIAAQVTAEGYRATRAPVVSASIVARVREAHGWTRAGMGAASGGQESRRDGGRRGPILAGENEVILS